MTVSFEVKYFKGSGELSHSYEEKWEKTELYCPNCGKPEVWHETGGGDYYVGETFICTACRHRFYLPSWVSPCDEKQDAQRLENLK